jgi:hypothetical protein
MTGLLGSRPAPAWILGALAIALGVVFSLRCGTALFRLGVRNAGRRRGRTALIVTGLLPPRPSSPRR